MIPDNTNLYVYKATCIRVVDGDTVDLDIDLGLDVHAHERVRLRGINTPETYGVKHGSAEYEAGMLAKRRVDELLMPGRDFELLIETHRDKTGKYGRYIAEIWVDASRISSVTVTAGTSWLKLGDILVEEGLAERREY